MKHTSDTMAIGLDLGGTNVRFALVTLEGRILHHQKIPVKNCRTEEQIIELIVVSTRELIRSSRHYPKQWLLGCGIPGIVSQKEGIIYSSPHYPLWKNFELKKRLRKILRFPVTIDNDANMIALGELWKGIAKKWNNFLMLTVGTGIGGALVIDSSLFCGDHGFAGEFGHIVIEREGHPCACGSRGCLETYVSLTALVRLVSESLERGTLPDMLAKIPRNRLGHETAILVEQGHPEAKLIYEKMGYALGIGIASLVNATGIQKIVLAGGLSRASSVLIQSAIHEVKNRVYQQTFKNLEIKIAKLGDDAGILGAAKRVFMANKLL